jgi:tRNA pseudouridine55 synthase
MYGFLNINKPVGITSHDAVARVRRLVGSGVKVGHAGTLDPAASGVLPLALGYATRLIEYLAAARKGYRAVVRLGATTTTDDAEGEVLIERPVAPLDEAAIERALAPLRGTILQVPPMYSALHHQGRRLYDLARAGQTVERAPREVTIDRLELVDFGLESEQAKIVIDVECSKGTYIRSLARDLGEALGCGAHLGALERTFVGRMELEQATPLAVLEGEPALLPRLLLPPESAVAEWPALQLDAEQAVQVRNGRALALVGQAGDQLRAHAPGGVLLALLRRQGDMWHPEKVFL